MYGFSITLSVLHSENLPELEPLENINIHNSKGSESIPECESEGFENTKVPKFVQSISDGPYFMTQEYLNDLLRDLNLSKNQTDNLRS